MRCTCEIGFDAGCGSMVYWLAFEYATLEKLQKQYPLCGTIAVSAEVLHQLRLNLTQVTADCLLDDTLISREGQEACMSDLFCHFDHQGAVSA